MWLIIIQVPKKKKRLNIFKSMGRTQLEAQRISGPGPNMEIQLI